MPVKRNAGKDIGPRPLLLDRARKVKPVRVRRAPLYKRMAKPTLALAVILGVGGVVVYRGVSGVDTTRVIQAAPWLKGYLPSGSEEKVTPAVAGPSGVALPPRREVTPPEVLTTPELTHRGATTLPTDEAWR